MSKIHQINISDGGVPKEAVDRADVGERGICGDRQDDTKHHGSPGQALCLWSLEVITQLQAEGHPIGPGRAGENITTTGLDWPSMTQGQQFRLGDTLQIELTSPAIPCGKNAQWFSDRNYQRIHHEVHPGDARWYAKVLVGGSIAPGDSITRL